MKSLLPLIMILCPIGILTASSGERMKPLALHPDNPHYFLWRGKPTIFITSGEHYGAVLNLDFDYVPYLEELQAQRLNLTRTFVGTYREISNSFGITDNTLAPKPQRYLCPWARSNMPGYFDGGNKFDLTKWDNAFFRRLRDFMTQAQRRGVVVEMNLFTPMYDESLWKANPMNAANNINRVGQIPATEVFTLKHPDLLAVQEACVRKIVAELNEFDNLYYEVCNEPYFGGVTTEWHDHIVDIIIEAEENLPARHLISHNVANGRARILQPNPKVSIFNFHYCHPPDTVEMNYHLNKAIGENETGFRGRDDVLYRTEGWNFIIAGGALYNNLDYSFTPRHPRGDFLDYTSPGGGSPALRAQLKILGDFINRFDFISMRPDNSIIKKGVPDGATARALVNKGHAYAIYVHGGTMATLTLDIPAGRYRTEWLNPCSGIIEKTEDVTHHGGDLTLVSPSYTEDIALRLATR